MSISVRFNIWDSTSALFFFFCILCLGLGSKAQAKKVVVLKSNDSDVVLNANVLNSENTTFKVYSHYSLSGKTVKVGKGSEIEFIDGSISNGVVFLAKGCRLYGNKQQCTDLQICVAGDGVEVNGLKAVSSGNAVIYSYSSCSSLKILNCEINALKGNGIKIVADKIRGVIKNLVFRNNSISFGRMGIEIQNHGNKEYRYDGVNIDNCYLLLNMAECKYGYGISLSGYGCNAIISNCFFDAVREGVEIVGFRDVVINSNQFDNISQKVIVASNRRPMSNISITNNVANCRDAKLQFANSSKIDIGNNKFNILLVELIGCSACRIANNKLTTNGHYAVILDGGKLRTENNMIYKNEVLQQGENWAVFRCYGIKSKKNSFENNIVKRMNKKGVAFDQIKGASDNIFK